MTATRNIPVRKDDLNSESDEPIIDKARRISAQTGRSLRNVLNELRAEKRARAEERAIAEAPPAEKDAEGNYKRISDDPRWPYGIENRKVIAPYGFTANQFPKTTAADTKNMTAQARKEARDIILDKLKRMGCDPIAIMAELAMSDTVKDEVRLRAAAELSSMVYPRLKGVENQIKQENTVFVIGVPTEKPETGDEWLAGAEGARRLQVPDAIEGEAVDITEEKQDGSA